MKLLWLGARVFACVLLGWALVAPGSAQAQLGRKASRGATPSASSADGTNDGELVSEGENPVVRFAVAHVHVHLGLFTNFHFCSGYLYFSRDTIRYEVAPSEADKGHAFEFKRADLSGAGEWHKFGGGVPPNVAEFKFPEGSYHFFDIPSSQIGNVGFGLKDLRSFPSRVQTFSSQTMINAANNLDQVVSMLKTREAARQARRPVATPPTISLLQPAGIEAGKSFATSFSKLRLRGIATHASGITEVSVNGETASLRTLAPQTVEFEIANLSVNPGASAVVVLATASDKSQGQLIFTVNRGEVKVLDPAPNFETREGTIKVRGVARGFHDVETVELAGIRGSLRRRDNGEVEFEFERVPLTVGSNTLQGFLSAGNGVREDLQLTVKRLPPSGPPPLALDDVLELLRGGVTPARTATLVRQRGVSFTLTPEAKQQIGSAGGTERLLQTIDESRK